MKLHQNSVFFPVSPIQIGFLKYACFSDRSTLYSEMFCDFSAVSNDDKMPVKKNWLNSKSFACF